NAYDRLKVAAEIGRDLDLVEPKLFGMTHVANTLNLMTRFAEAKAAAQEALAVARDAGHLGYEAELMAFTIPLNLIAHGDFEGAMKSAEAGTNLAIQIGSAERECFGELAQGMIARMTGRYEDAIAFDKRSVDAAQIAGSTFIEAAAQCELGSAYLDTSPAFADQTSAYHTDALATLDKPMGGALGAMVWANIGFCAVQLGDVDRAEEMFRLGLEVRTGSQLFSKPQLLMGLGLVAAARGDLEGAMGQLKAAREIAEGRQMKHYMPFIEMIDGVLAGHAQQPDKALEYLVRSEELASKLGMLPVVWQARAGMASTLMTLGRDAEAETKRSEARSVIDEIASGFEDAELRDAYVGSARGQLEGE
ncbi:MAG: hypothetical protein V3S98_02340, partial [Dehalococcoidia bacterium]